MKALNWHNKVAERTDYGNGRNIFSIVETRRSGCASWCPVHDNKSPQESLGELLNALSMNAIIAQLTLIV